MSCLRISSDFKLRPSALAGESSLLKARNGHSQDIYAQSVSVMSDTPHSSGPAESGQVLVPCA